MLNKISNDQIQESDYQYDEAKRWGVYIPNLGWVYSASKSHLEFLIDVYNSSVQQKNIDEVLKEKELKYFLIRDVGEIEKVYDSPFDLVMTEIIVPGIKQITGNPNIQNDLER